MSRKPLIGVSACTKQIGHHSFHIAGDKYLRAAAIAGVPLVIPALDELIDPATLLESFDGLLFTGSPSNVEPHHYGGPASEPGTHHDPFRDRLTLPLIRAAVDAGIPVFGICRGFQEMNVAFGGSLHQKVHEAGPIRTTASARTIRWRCSTASAMRCTCSLVGCSSALACRRRSRSIRCMGRVSSVSAPVCASRRWLPTG